MFGGRQRRERTGNAGWRETRQLGLSIEVPIAIVGESNTPRDLDRRVKRGGGVDRGKTTIEESSGEPLLGGKNSRNGTE